MIRDLAAGEMTQVQLAAKYGVVQSSISGFASRHRDSIDHLKTRANEEWAALWAADKFNRVAELQSDVDSMRQPSGDDAAQMYRVKHAALRQIAEELGQLRQTVEVGGRITYTITGIDPAALR